MLHFLDNRPGEKYVWHDDSPASPTTPKMWQTFPGHFLKKYEKYLKKNSAKVLGTPEAKPKHRFDDRYVDNKDMTAITAVDKDAIQVTFEKVVPHKENWNKNKKAKLKVTQPPPTGLSALASFPVSGKTWARAHVTKLNEIANYMCFFHHQGSGNTWLRYLLQQATGIYTGSVYKDFGLLKSGFPAESICNSSVLVVKTHEVFIRLLCGNSLQRISILWKYLSCFFHSGDQMRGNHSPSLFYSFAIQTNPFRPNSIDRAAVMSASHRPTDTNEPKDDVS